MRPWEKNIVLDEEEDNGSYVINHTPLAPAEEHEISSDILKLFIIFGDALEYATRRRVEEHLKVCHSCKAQVAKYS